MCGKKIPGVWMRNTQVAVTMWTLLLDNAAIPARSEGFVVKPEFVKC